MTLSMYVGSVARARGVSICARYAQGFIATEPLKVDDPFMLAIQRRRTPSIPHLMDCSAGS